MFFKYNCVVFCFVAFFSAIDVCVNADCGVVSRRTWGAQPASDITYMARPVCIVIIQHTVTDTCDNAEECKSIIKAIQNNHMDAFGDIAMSFVIGGDGKVYEGRGWNKVGTHTYHYNSRSIGISFIGDFTNALPTASAMEAAKKLIECGVAQGHLSKDYKLFGHRQLVALGSPGTRFYREIKTWKNWSSDVDNVKNPNTFKCQK